jgi:4-amino-4-deoxy-L-arabinose transferase-like glycosyltransferase
VIARRATPALRGVRIALAAALVALGAWLAGPFRPGALPGSPTFVPEPGQSHIHTVLVALWWAAAVNAALVALLLATSAFWTRPLRRPPRGRASGARLGTAGLALVALAVLAAGALRWPLAHGSVWWDEAWTIRNTIVGKLDPAPGDPSRAVLEPAPWRKALWYYHAPTNHVAYTVAARVANDAWRALAGAPPHAFDEFALRLPALVAAVAAVALLALLLARLGFPRAAPVAALLLALHPLHVRHGAEARGYGFVVLFTIVGAWFLLRALRGGRWRDFLAYAASQLLLLWTFPLAVYVPLAFALAGFAAIALSREWSPADRATLAARFVVANVLAAMAFLALMAPNLAQAAAFKKEWHDDGTLDLVWIRRFWATIATGMPLRAPRLPEVWFPTLTNLAERRSWVMPAVYGVLPGLAAIGFARAMRRPGAPERAVWVGLALATGLFLVHRELQAFFLLPRFVIFALPAFLGLTAVGLDGLVAAATRRLRRPERAAVPALALAIAAFGILVAPALLVLHRRPITASSELVAFLAEAGAGIPGGALRAGVGLGGDAPRVYDPHIVEIETLPQLEALCARARESGTPLYVFYAFTTVNMQRLPGLFMHIRDTREFEPIATLPGIDPDMVIHVHRYTGRPLGAS